MDIPGLITPFGEGNNLVIAKLIKDVKFKAADLKKQKINVFLDLDLDEGKIKFQIIDYKDNSSKTYNYCGNNSSAGSQFFLVRDIDSLKYYWQDRMKKGVFMNLIHALGNGELKEMLQEGEKKELFSARGLCFDKMELLSGAPEKYEFDYEENSIVVENSDTGEREKISSEKFIKQILDMGHNVKIGLVIPRILKNGQACIISTHEDYLDHITKIYGGGDSGKLGVCHICSKEKANINSEKYKKFSRNGIGKVFVTTQVNYAPYFRKVDHQKNYSICIECYEEFTQGEIEVLKKFGLRIANEDCVLLFEGLDKKINPAYLPEIKNNIELVFNPKNSQEWAMQFQRELKKRQQIELYQFNMVFYKTDGKSTAIKKAIENISFIRFDQVIRAFDTGGMRLGDFLKNFTLGHIYTLVPVNKDKKGKQVNIHRLLDLYSAIIKGQPIEKKYIFELYGEGIGRLVNELRASKIRNYENIISYRPKVPGKTTSFELDKNIKEYTFKYLAFIHSLKELKLLDKEVMKLTKENVVINEEEDLNQVVDFIAERERFLEEQGFSSAAKGLFYMGALLYEIGNAQYRQKHKNKPILDKIDYQGMDDKAVLALYTQDILEKLRQYAKHVNSYYCEAYKKMLHQYLGIYDNLKGLSHQETVFYLMAGYSYSVSLIKKKEAAPDSGETGELTAEVFDHDLKDNT